MGGENTRHRTIAHYLKKYIKQSNFLITIINADNFFKIKFKPLVDSNKENPKSTNEKVSRTDRWRISEENCRQLVHFHPDQTPVYFSPRRGLNIGTGSSLPARRRSFPRNIACLGTHYDGEYFSFDDAFA